MLARELRRIVTSSVGKSLDKSWEVGTRTSKSSSRHVLIMRATPVDADVKCSTHRRSSESIGCSVALGHLCCGSLPESSLVIVAIMCAWAIAEMEWIGLVFGVVVLVFEVSAIRRVSRSADGASPHRHGS